MNLLCLQQFYCLHHLEGGIVHCLERRAQISMDVKGCFLPREFDYSVLYRNMLWVDSCYFLPFQLYMAWGCDMINKIASLKYRLNVCSISLSSKYGSQRGKRICLMACTKITDLKVLSFPTPPCAELLVWSQSTSWIREPLGAFVSCKQLQKSHSREALFSVALCITVDKLHKMAFAHWMQQIFANLVGTMWCWQQNWFLIFLH